MNKKALTILTIAAMLTSVLVIASSYYLPSTDAPEVNLTLHDADGVKMVSVGETAEYVILIENKGSTTGHIDLSREGTASGWESRLSHDDIHLRPGDEQLISLYVTPTGEDAEPSIDVNVKATRGDNVTIIATSTYLKGNVLIRKAGETEWQSYTQDTEIGEGDDIKTEMASHAQITFPEVYFILRPNSEIHVRFIHMISENATYEFHLNTGEAAFRVELPTSSSMFTLKTADGARVMSTSVDISILLAEANGNIRVFKGVFQYYPPQTRERDDTTATNISAGHDSSGDTFNYAILMYDNDVVTGILRNQKGETIGFDNSGDFVANGDLDGFVFRLGGTDTFYVYGLDIDPLYLNLSNMKPGTFDLAISRYSPDLKAFVFKDMTSPSGTAQFSFKGDEVYLQSDSELNYDFEIRYKEIDRFYLNDMTLKAGQGNIFKVLNYIHLANDEVNTVLFGIDNNGDGKADDEIMIHTGMTGEQVYDDLEDEDEASGYILIAFALAIILIIAGMYFILQQGGQDLGGPGPESIPDGSEKEMDQEEIGQEEENPENGDREGRGEEDGDQEIKDGILHHDEPLGPGIGEDWDSVSPPVDMGGQPPEEDIFEDRLEEISGGAGDASLTMTEEEAGEGEGEGVEQISSIAEDMVERKRDMVLDEDFEPIIELPPELQPVESENPFELPQEQSLPARLGIDPDVSGDLEKETELQEGSEPSAPDVEDGDDEDDGLNLDLDLFPEEEPVIAPPRKTRRMAPRKAIAGEEEGSDDDSKKYSINEIRGSLQNVRELKKEMETVEPGTSDDEWWGEWNDNMKKQIEALDEEEESKEED